MPVRRFEQKRAVEITSPQYGSGYRIGGHLVLTAAHLFEDADDAICTVRDKDGFGECEAEQVSIIEGADIALVELPETVAPCDSVVFGKMPTHPLRLAWLRGEIDFEMYGYPEWAFVGPEHDRVSGGMHCKGKIYLEDTMLDDLLGQEVTRGPTHKVKRAHWQGISGAAVLIGGLVVAVQCLLPNPEVPRYLAAEPLSKVYKHPLWQAILTNEGIDPNPKPIGLLINPIKLRIGLLIGLILLLIGIAPTGIDRYVKTVLLPSQARNLNQDVLVEPNNPVTIGGHHDPESPTHKIRQTVLEPYYLDIHEVTNAEYRLCVQAGICTQPREEESSEFPEMVWAGFRKADDNMPVTQVTAFQAYRYCDWLGKRLPDVAELEYAARDDELRPYPWGNTEPELHTHVNMVIPTLLPTIPTDEDNLGQPVAVDDPRYQAGTTPETHFAHLIGNVSEWTRTPATEICKSNIYECDTWDGIESLAGGVYLYGDSWFGEVSPSTASYVSGWDLNETFYHIGFRCAYTGS